MKFSWCYPISRVLCVSCRDNKLGIGPGRSSCSSATQCKFPGFPCSQKLPNQQVHPSTCQLGDLQQVSGRLQVSLLIHKAGTVTTDQLRLPKEDWDGLLREWTEVALSRLTSQTTYLVGLVQMRNTHYGTYVSRLKSLLCPSLCDLRQIISLRLSLLIYKIEIIISEDST